MLSLLLLPTSIGTLLAAVHPHAELNRNRTTGNSVVVYGATAAGVTAAVAAAREGAQVTLINDRANVGGMTSGGLGKTDVGISAAIGGQAAAFYEAMGTYYNLSLPILDKPLINVQPEHCDPAARPCRYYGFEPSVAEAYLRRQLEGAGVELLEQEHVIALEMAAPPSKAIAALVTNTSRRIFGTVYVDASYEGDLLPLARVSHRIGREAASEYNESLAGVYTSGPYSTCRCSVSPWADATNKTLVASVQRGPLGPRGSADKKVQAYDFRVTLTNDSANAIPITKPEDYDPAQFEYLRRLHTHRQPLRPGVLNVSGGRWCLIPTGKGNVGGFSKTDLNGEDLTGPNFAWDYPNASSWQARQVIWDRYVSYIKAHLWFLRSDPSVPMEIREAMGGWGWPKDEFLATGHFPHALYVREARRLVGTTVMTQQDVALGRHITKNESVGLGSYDYDAHYSQRVPCSCGGYFGVQDEGGIPHGGRKMFQVPRAAIVPKSTECSNLVVPVCASATHIGLSAMRLEPTYMILGESAGILAALSAKYNVSVQNVPYMSLLRPKLLAAQQRLEAPPSAPVIAQQPFTCIQAWDRCIQMSAEDASKGSWPNRTYNESSCAGSCSSLGPKEWLANVGEFTRNGTGTLVARKNTWLKKSEMNSAALPPSEKQDVPARSQIKLANGPGLPPESRQGNYWLIECAEIGCGLAAPEISQYRTESSSKVHWWDGTFCDS